MKYCKECGAELKEGAQFCKECGTPVGENKETNNTLEEPTSKQPQEQATTRHTYEAPNQEMTRATKTPMSKKRKMSLIATGVALIILFSGYKIGETLTSKDRLIDKFQTALSNKDAKTVASLLSSDDKNLKINEKSVQGLMKYFDKNPDIAANAMKDLKTESNLYDQRSDLDVPKEAAANNLLNQEMISLEKIGKILFYDKYTININSVYVTLSTNYKNTELSIDGKNLGKADSADFQKTYGPFVPGIHDAQADLKTNFVDLKTHQEAELINSNRTSSIDLSLDGQDVSVDAGQNGNTNLDAKLFINGKDVGVNPFKKATFGPVLTDGSMNLSLEASMPWGKIKTSEVPIKDTNIQVNLVDDATKKAIMDQIMKFMNEEMQAFTSDNTSKMTTATANGKIDVKNIADSDASNRFFYSQNYEGALESMKFQMDNGFSTQYDSSTSTWYMNEDAEGTINEAYFNQGQTPALQENTKDYTFTLVYDTSAKKWLVEHFQLSDSSGDSRPTDKVVTVNKPIMYATNAAPVTTAGISSSSSIPSNVETTMDGYENGLINAVNDNDFTDVSSYLLPDSPLYNDQQQLVTKLSNTGTTEQLLSYQITDYKDNGNGACAITTHEKVQINYSSGKSDTKDYDWVYTGKIDPDGTLALTDISAKK